MLWHRCIHNLNNVEHPKGSQSRIQTVVALSKHHKNPASFFQAIQCVQNLIFILALTTKNSVSK